MRHHRVWVRRHTHGCATAMSVLQPCDANRQIDIGQGRIENRRIELFLSDATVKGAE